MAPTTTPQSTSRGGRAIVFSQKKQDIMASRGPGRPPKRPRLENERYAANGLLIPNFSADTLEIYRFAPPTITNFPDICAERRVEKNRLDQKDADAYIDDGADDWDDFAVTPADSTEHGEGTMVRAIASTFMNRAKVAYRSRKSWAKFEDEELAVKTQAAARAEPDLVKRQILLDGSLCEKSRLQVFNRIKVRLCTEIFLEHYNERRLASRQDSVMPATEEYSEEEKLLLGWDRVRPLWKESESIKPWRNSRPDICSNCGTDRPNYLEDPRCPQCKTVEEASWSERPDPLLALARKCEKRLEMATISAAPERRGSTIGTNCSAADERQQMK